jgi:hypothetical protein
MLHPVRVEDQTSIEEEFLQSLEACDALDKFGRAHRPSRESGSTPVLNWTLARSTRTFKIIVKLCRLGFGQQASMLNRTLFEDMIFAHWAAQFPKRSTRLIVWHEQYVKLRRIAVYEDHKIRHNMTAPKWDATREKRMRGLFRRQTWTGRSIPKMVEKVEEMWPRGEDRDRLKRMHDVLHQGHNTLMHHSSRSLSFGVEVDGDGNAKFNLGPSSDLVALALGFAFWTYANMLSLTVQGDDLEALNELATRYDHVVPDRSLRKMIAEAESAAETTEEQ